MTPSRANIRRDAKRVKAAATPSPLPLLVPLAYLNQLVYDSRCSPGGAFGYGADAYLVEVEVAVDSARMPDFNV
ncbi:MAG TPA: hypothetical protein VK685_06980 [Candidatus Acidoferrum sp.]|nr:hypothetical protein [Candidatus Acidoferrum sp.]